VNIEPERPTVKNPPDGFMEHLAILEAGDAEPTTVWSEHVPEGEYPGR
jgi:hypothetical protein